MQLIQTQAKYFFHVTKVRISAHDIMLYYLVEKIVYVIYPLHRTTLTAKNCFLLPSDYQ